MLKCDLYALPLATANRLTHTHDFNANTRVSDDTTTKSSHSLRNCDASQLDRITISNFLVGHTMWVCRVSHTRTFLLTLIDSSSFIASHLKWISYQRTVSTRMNIAKLSPIFDSMNENSPFKWWFGLVFPKCHFNNFINETARRRHSRRPRNQN